MELKYGLDERPPFIELLLFGLQWFAVTIPVIIIIGKIAAGLHTSSPEGEILYIQKLSFVMAAALVLQVTLGHRLPLIIGPSTVLLIGIIASRGFGEQAIYSSILLGGVLLFIFSITGFFAYLKKFFTTRVVAVVMLLIAFTMAPTIMGLVTSPQTGPGPLGNLVFSFALIAAMVFLYAVLKGIWKSTLVIWAMAAGSLIYYGLFPYAFSPEATPEIPGIGRLFQQVHFPAVMGRGGAHILPVLLPCPGRKRPGLDPVLERTPAPRGPAEKDHPGHAGDGPRQCRVGLSRGHRSG